MIVKTARILFMIDKVSWLPPGHPKAKITEAASHVREMIQNQIHMDPEVEESDDDDEHAMDLDSVSAVFLSLFEIFFNIKSNPLPFLRTVNMTKKKTVK